MDASIGLEIKILFLDCHNFLILYPIKIKYVADCIV